MPLKGTGLNATVGNSAAVVAVGEGGAFPTLPLEPLESTGAVPASPLELAGAVALLSGGSTGAVPA